jgi:magnesium transporter
MLDVYTCANGTLRRIAEPHDEAVLRNAVWIDLVDPTAEETARVTSATGLAVPTREDVGAIESSSRLGLRDGVLYVTLPLLSMIESPHSVPAGFVLSSERLLTVRFAPSRIFDRFAARLVASMPRVEYGAHVLVGLLEAIADRQADALEQVSSELETISHRIFTMGVTGAGRKREDRMLRQTLESLGRLGDMISHVRETQVAAGLVVPFVVTSAESWLPKDLQARLKALRRDISSISDFDTHLNDKLQLLLNATLGFINIAQNNVMKVLTVWSIAGIPPTLIAGIYGMNFKGMPEYDWSWGYPYGLTLILLSAMVPLLIFRWRGWV